MTILEEFTKAAMQGILANSAVLQCYITKGNMQMQLMDINSVASQAKEFALKTLEGLGYNAETLNSQNQ